MRIAIVALLLAVASSAHAQQQHDPYRWCADYAGHRGLGATNCYFMTLQQCQWAVSGVGGYCKPNPFFTGDNPPPRKKKKATS